MLAAIIGGIIVPFSFVMIVSGGKTHVKELIIGIILSLISMLLINETHSYLYFEGKPILTALAQGFSIAIAQRLLITIAVLGKTEEKAAWLGFGFGILESTGVLLPIAPMYSMVIFKGHTLYQLYRKSLNSLFQSASAMILSKASIPKITLLILIQGIGLSIIILDYMGEITFLTRISNFAWLAILGVPISTLVKKEQ